MKCIFLVEDNADNAELIKDILGADYHIVHFADPRILLSGIDEKILPMPELLLLDIALPSFDGVELLRKLRKDPAYAPVPAIALTANALQHDRERFLAAGFDGYVSKPIIDEGTLLKEIANLISRTP